MPTYYVRKTGNDGNTGLNPTTQAWLTIDHAANNVAAGDTVYIGGGVYREQVTMDTSGTSGNEISFIGDIDGVQTGDPGPVIITAHDAENAGPARNSCLELNTKEFIIWQYVSFLGGTVAAINYNGAANWGMDGLEFLDCSILAGSGTGSYSLTSEINTGAVPTVAGLRMKRCTLVGTLRIVHDNNASAHVDIDLEMENCLVIAGGTSVQGVNFACTVTNTYSITGATVANCIFVGCVYAVQGTYLKETTTQVKVVNCRGIACNYMAYESLCTNDAMFEDYNILQWGNAAIKLGDVQQGGNSDATTSEPMLGGIGDLMFYNKLGWSPWLPWEPMSLLDGTYLEPGIGFASAAYAPADDVYGNSRPMGRTSADDAGAVEARVRPQEDTVALDTVAAFLGAGYLDMMAAVDAALTTFTVVGRYDANYAGSLPIFYALEIPGVADQSDVMTAAANTDETLSVTFTPTSAGYVRLRLQSRDTSANGEAYFKDLVSA